MQYLSIIADIVGIAGAAFALLAWLKARQLQADFQRERQRQQRTVTVVLQHGAARHDLPVYLRRAEFTRAEVLGRLGMLPMLQPSARFNLGYLNNPEFFRQINEISAGSGDATLTIPCTKEEFEQFAL
jgi:hypothetical protein